MSVEGTAEGQASQGPVSQRHIGQNLDRVEKGQRTGSHVIVPDQNAEAPGRPQIRISEEDTHSRIGDIITGAEAIKESVDSPTDVESQPDRELTLNEAIQKEHEITQDLEKLTGSLDILRQHLGEKDATILLLQNHLTQLEVQIHNVRLQTIDNRSVQLSTFEQIAGTVIRVGLITLFAAVVGGPALVLATKVVFGEKIAEGAVTGFIAAVSTEIANRFADPTSHKHRD